MQVKTYSIGDGHVVDVIIFDDGQVICISDDCICRYPTEDNFLSYSENFDINCIIRPSLPRNTEGYFSEQRQHIYVKGIIKLNNATFITLFDGTVITFDSDYIFLYNNITEANLNDHELAIDSISFDIVHQTLTPTNKE